MVAGGGLVGHCGESDNAFGLGSRSGRMCWCIWQILGEFLLG